MREFAAYRLDQCPPQRRNKARTLKQEYSLARKALWEMFETYTHTKWSAINVPRQDVAYILQLGEQQA